MGARGQGALQKNIIIGVRTGAHFLGRLDPESILPNRLECVLDHRLAAAKFGNAG